MVIILLTYFDDLRFTASTGKCIHFIAVSHYKEAVYVAKRQSFGHYSTCFGCVYHTQTTLTSIDYKKHLIASNGWSTVSWSSPGELYNTVPSSCDSEIGWCGRN